MKIRVVTIRKGDAPVLLDFPYCYKLDGKKLFCSKVDMTTHELCNGEIDYDKGFNHLVCTRCGKIYLATDLRDDSIDNKIIIKGGVQMKIILKKGDRIIGSPIQVDEVMVPPKKKRDYKSEGLVVRLSGGRFAKKNIPEEKTAPAPVESIEDSKKANLEIEDAEKVNPEIEETEKANPEIEDEEKAHPEIEEPSKKTITVAESADMFAEVTKKSVRPAPTTIEEAVKQSLEAREVSNSDYEDDDPSETEPSNEINDEAETSEEDADDVIDERFAEYDDDYQYREPIRKKTPQRDQNGRFVSTGGNKSNKKKKSGSKGPTFIPSN